MSFMDDNLMTKTAHPPYSPNLAPSDFFLFSEVKKRLGGCFFDNADELLGPIHDILELFEAETLNRVYCEWMTRLQCIDTRGEYAG
jgi:hypothetical protein